MKINLKVICNECGEEMEISSTKMTDEFTLVINPCKECIHNYNSNSITNV